MGNQTEQKVKEKKKFYKKWWFWVIIAVLVIGTIGSQGSDETDKSSAKSDSASKTSTKSDTAKKDTATADLKAKYDAIVVGDILDPTGGTPLADVVSVFGKPASTSTSSIDNVTTQLSMWSGLDGGTILSSLSTSSTSDLVVSKSISGLKIEKGNKATLEQFSSVPTDGSFTYDSAIAQFGNADGLTETMIGGQKSIIATWSTNVEGDLGANINFTFIDGVVTGAAQYGLK